MTNQDDNNQKIEKVEDVEVETTKKTSDSDDKKQNDDEYEKVCFICRRPESAAGKMIELPNHICVCNDCMQKSFDAMSNGPIDYSQLMNIPGVQVFNMSDMEQSIPKQQKIKKKKEGEEYKPLVDIRNLPAPHKIKAKLDEYVVGQEYAKKVMSVAVMFQVPRRFYIGCGITGSVGWMMYKFASVYCSVAAASFVGTVCAVLVARMLTVRLKCPITIFMISGIITLVPGAGIYFTAYYLVTNQFAMAAAKGIGAIKVAFGIVLGIVCIVSVPREVFQKEYWVERKIAKQQKNGKRNPVNLPGERHR